MECTNAPQHMVPQVRWHASGFTLLHWAAESGREEIVRLCLEAGASAGANPVGPDAAGKTPSASALRGVRL